MFVNRSTYPLLSTILRFTVVLFYWSEIRVLIVLKCHDLGIHKFNFCLKTFVHKNSLKFNVVKSYTVKL